MNKGNEMNALVTMLLAACLILGGTIAVFGGLIYGPLVVLPGFLSVLFGVALVAILDRQ